MGKKKKVVKSKDLNNKKDVTSVKKGNKKRVLAIILIILLIIIIFLLVLYNRGGIAINTDKYKKLESELEKKTKKVVIDNNFIFENPSKNRIVIDKLISNNIISKDELYDCDGYVTINTDEFSDNKYKAYIKCPYKYKTKGYKNEYAKKGKLNILGKNLYLYEDKKTGIVSYKYSKTDDEKLIKKYSCNEEGCTAETDSGNVVVHNDRYIVIYDNKNLYLYDIKDDKILDPGISSISVKIKDVKTDNNYYMIINTIKNTNHKSVLYSPLDNKILFEKEGKDYVDISYPNVEYLNRGYLVVTNEDFSQELFDLKTLKIKENSKIEKATYSYYDKYQMPIISCADEIDLLDSNMNRVFNKLYYITLSVDNLIYGCNANTKEYRVYDKDTDKVEVKYTNYPLLGLVKNYIVINKNGVVTLTDYDNNFVKEICSLGNNMYDSFMSGYYDAHDDRPAGLYLVFSNDSSECFEYHYNETTKVVTRYNLDECGNYGKPVLYLYPKKETTITVNFEKENALTTTYPKFNNEWKVKASPNGDLYDENGKYYYGLYWEEKLNHRVDFSTGFYVTKDNSIEFLEEKLSIIGLNDREKNEFIMYWLPILEKNEKNLVYFELTEERDSYNKLMINPKPDSLLRVAIHVKKVDKKVNIKEEKLEKFDRKGFTAVEWGGVNY